MNDTGNFVFTLTATLAVAMTLVYFPLRFFLTLTARSRRLKLLQRIRKLRDELGQPYESIWTYIFIPPSMLIVCPVM